MTAREPNGSGPIVGAGELLQLYEQMAVIRRTERAAAAPAPSGPKKTA